MNKRVMRGVGLSCAAIAFQAALPAVAQQTETSGVVLEEIVVTAQRRAESMQDTAVSISALTGTDLKDAGIGRLEDASSALPNVYIGPRDLRTTSITIRGISADLNNPGLDQSVGVYVDGVYMGRAATINSNLFDLERIEALRGPQGTLYGRNTVAGAVNFITRKPTAEARTAGSLSIGNYGAARANAVTSGALTDTLFASISASLDTRDGLVHNKATGTDLDDVNGSGGRLTLVYDPGGDVDVTLRADASRDRTHSGAFDILKNGVMAGTPLADADPYDRTVNQSTDTTQKRDVYGASAELNWRAEPGTLTAITAGRGYKWDNIQENDYTVLDMLDTGIKEKQSQLSQEVRFASDAAERFSYVVGAFYFDQQLDTISKVQVGTDLGIYPKRVPVSIYADVNTKSYAAFGRATYRLTDSVNIAAGLRYTYEEKKVDFKQDGDPYGAIAGSIPRRLIKGDEDKVSPSLTLEWRPQEDMLTYASYSQGYKSGGFNIYSITATDDASYKPENVDNYEVGLKSEFLDRHLRFNAAAFFMDYRDLQQNQLVTTAGGISRFQTANAAKVESKGVELELTAIPMQELQVTVNYGYVDATFTSYPNATAKGADYTGNHLALAPAHTFSAAAEWTRPLVNDLEFYLRGEVSYRSRIYFASNNTFDDPGLTLLNARAGIGPESGAWRITFWGRNLTNETYAINQFEGAVLSGQVVQALGTPRTYGVELSFQF